MMMLTTLNMNLKKNKHQFLIEKKTKQKKIKFIKTNRKKKVNIRFYFDLIRPVSVNVFVCVYVGCI